MYQARKSPLFLNLTSNDAPLRNEAHSPHGYGGDQRAVTMRPISTPRTTQNCPSHAAEPSCLCLLETGTCSLKFREIITSKYVQSSSPPPFPSGAPPSQPLRPPSGPPGARVPPCGAGDGVSPTGASGLPGWSFFRAQCGGRALRLSHLLLSKAAGSGQGHRCATAPVLRPQTRAPSQRELELQPGTGVTIHVRRARSRLRTGGWHGQPRPRALAPVSTTKTSA